jgi:inorganic pyrophosphatase
MSNLEAIDPQLDREALTCRVVVETPKGARSKYTYDPDTGAFQLSGLLPDGMSFPLDFGFVPSTLAEDGDPIDVLVLADEPCVVGALADVRLIGVVKGEQTEEQGTVRNDRLVAVSCVSHLFAHVASVDDLGEDFMTNLSQFWVNYNALKDRRFKVIGVDDAQSALRLIEEARRKD